MYSNLTGISARFYRVEIFEQLARSIIVLEIKNTKFLVKAIRIASDKDIWQNGPEYTFSARTSMIVDLDEDKGNYKGTSLVNKLKCRPKEPRSLVCRFEDSKFVRLSPRAFNAEETVPDADATFSPFGFGDDAHFEVKFNEKGIESYTFDNNTLSAVNDLSNMYRLIANQLSLGVTINDTLFRTMENFTIGECSVICKVSRHKPTNRTARRTFEISSLIDLDVIDENVVEIVKERQLQDCIPHPVYFFGTRYTYGLVYRGTIEKLMFASSRMLISKSSFTADSVNVVDLYDEGRKKIGSALDHIQLTLESVDPARGQLPTISNPKTTDVILDVNKNCS